MLLNRAAAGLVFLLAIMTFQVSNAAETQEEIASLLRFVEHSKCIFIRNDKEYTGTEARGHIERKYDHFKEKIATTEDFIRLAATKSLMSGRPYTVRCKDMEMNLADWLQAELGRLRTDQKSFSEVR